MRFEDVLPLLTAAYDKGRLVPFLGSGMSAPICTTWQGFVENLEKRAGLFEPGKKMENIVPRAHQAVRLLRAGLVDAEFRAQVRDALWKDMQPPAGVEPTPQTCALASVWWPLVLTTNYDDLYFHAVRQAHGAKEVQLAGRNQRDCHSIVGSLTRPSPPYIWCLQGYLGGQCSSETTPEALDQDQKGRFQPPFVRLLDDVVVGHGEYRTATFAQPHFRRCFAEVFRQRSFLFLGSSLSEDYFLNLFGEVVEMYGNNPMPHFAFAAKGSVDSRFLLEQLNIVVCEYENPDKNHRGNVDWLNALAKHLKGTRCRPMSSAFLIQSPARIEASNATPDFEIRRDVLPGILPPDECLAVSIGCDEMRHPSIGPSIAKLLGTSLVQTLQNIVLADGQQFVKCGERDIYGLLARDRNCSRPDKRDLRSVSKMTLEFLNHASQQQYKRVHIQLLSAGPGTTFPPLYSFVEMARGCGQWLRVNPNRKLKIACYVVDPSVLHNVMSGRICIHELLSSPLLRFWVELVSSIECRRMTLLQCGTTKVRQLLKILALPANGNWRIAISPSPTMHADSVDGPTLAEVSNLMLDELGVVSGSTIYFYDCRDENRPLQKRAVAN
jgi:hypothetical protein